MRLKLIDKDRKHIEDPKITLRLEMSDGAGGTYKSESSFEVFNSLGEKIFDAVCERFKTFLLQAGLVQNNRDVFIADVNQEDYEALENLLSILRNPIVLVPTTTEKGTVK